MNSHSITVGAFAVNSLILWDHPDQAWVIDPGGDPETILVFLQRHQLRPVRYFLTHGHIDHISALPALLNVFPAPVLLHPRDAAWAFSDQNAIPPYPPILTPPSDLQTNLSDNPCIRDGSLSLKIMETPGHTPGSLCFLFEADSLLCSGDTLFAGSVGRTDLPGGDPMQLANSLELLKALPDSLRVVPGHGPATTLGQERRNNPFFLSRPGRII